MSVSVDLSQLEAQLDEFGRTPYLVTTGEDLRPHTTHVVVALADGALRCGVGRRTAANATDRDLVCLLWAPHEPGGYSLIVDGRAAVGEDADGPLLSIAPTKAILHRNAGGDGYAADCVRLDGTRP